MSQEYTLDITWESILKVFFAIFIFYLIYLAKTVALWFLFGLAIAILVEPAILFFRKLKIPRVISALMVYFSIFGILALLIFISAPLFVDEMQQFSQHLPEYFNQVNPYLQGIGINVADSFNELSSGLLFNLKESSAGLVRALGAFFGGLSAAAFILTIAFFLSLEDRGVESLLALVAPKKYEEQIVFLFETVQQKVSGWFGARILACLFVGVASFIVFYMFSIKYALLLALISGVLNFVPYLGPVISTLLLAIIVSVTSGSWMIVLYILIAITVIQEIENKLLSPLLLKRIIDMPAVLVLVSLLVGTEVFGFLGAIFAVPVFGIIYEFTKAYLGKRKEEELSA